MTEYAQRSLFDPPSPEARRDEGMAQVWEHAGATWKVIAEEAIETLLRERETVTADDFRQVVPMSPGHFNAWGALTARLIKRGWLEPTGRYVKSTQPQGHANRLPVYRSGLFGHRGVAA